MNKQINEINEMLINIYNANTEPEQLHTLNDLINILKTFEDIQN